MAYILNELAERGPATFGHSDTTLQRRDSALSPARQKELTKSLDEGEKRQAEAWREQEVINVLRAMGLLVMRLSEVNG